MTTSVHLLRFVKLSLIRSIYHKCSATFSMVHSVVAATEPTYSVASISHSITTPDGALNICSAPSRQHNAHRITVQQTRQSSESIHIDRQSSRPIEQQNDTNHQIIVDETYQPSVRRTDEDCLVRTNYLSHNYSIGQTIQVAQLSQRDRATGCSLCHNARV